MVYRLLLDENVEHEIYHRLENHGHDVKHVDSVTALGKGAADRPIAEYSAETNRILVTYDDDFALKLSTSQRFGTDDRNRKRTPVSRSSLVGEVRVMNCDHTKPSGQ